jgi:hypothetical protein
VPGPEGHVGGTPTPEPGPRAQRYTLTSNVVDRRGRT